MTMLDRQFQYFLDNQQKLVDKYYGKVIVLHDDDVAGAFDSNLEAYLFGKGHFQPDTFLIQRCVEGPEAYTATVSTLGVIS